MFSWKIQLNVRSDSRCKVFFFLKLFLWLEIKKQLMKQEGKSDAGKWWQRKLDALAALFISSYLCQQKWVRRERKVREETKAESQRTRLKIRNRDHKSKKKQTWRESERERIGNKEKTQKTTKSNLSRETTISESRGVMERNRQSVLLTELIFLPSLVLKMSSVTASGSRRRWQRRRHTPCRL